MPIPKGGRDEAIAVLRQICWQFEEDGLGVGSYDNLAVRKALRRGIHALTCYDNVVKSSKALRDWISETMKGAKR